MSPAYRNEVPMLQARVRWVSMALLRGMVMAMITPAAAELYSDTELTQKLDRVRTQVVATVTQDIPKYVAPEYSSKVSALTVELPLRGGSPTLFQSVAKTQTIVIPGETLQFIDDLATLRAWLDKYRCESQTVLFPNYLHHLFQPAPLPHPLAAFGLRRDALLRDSFINDTSYKYYTSAVWFNIAHEIGHVVLGHASTIGDKSINQERLADAFAIDVMRRRHLTPAGVYLYFLATAFYEPVDGRKQIHPMSADRIRAVSAAMRQTPDPFVAPESKAPSADARRVLQNADTLDGIVPHLEKIQAIRGKLTKREDALAAIEAQVFPKVDFTRACAHGRRN